MLFLFSVVLLLVAPFHYAIGRWFYSMGEGFGALNREISQGLHWDYFPLTAALPPQGEDVTAEWAVTDSGTKGLIVQ